MTFAEACQEIVSDRKANEYARAYAQAGLEHEMDGKKAAVQCLYILSNLSRWRGEKAKEVKATLKAISEKRRESDGRRNH